MIVSSAVFDSIPEPAILTKSVCPTNLLNILVFLPAPLPLLATIKSSEELNTILIGENSGLSTTKPISVDDNHVVLILVSDLLTLKTLPPSVHIPKYMLSWESKAISDTWLSEPVTLVSGIVTYSVFTPVVLSIL